MEGNAESSPPVSAGLLVGHVAALWRYPVKSMAGEALHAVEVSWHGLAGDRRWAFIRDGVVRSGFPWLTARELPALLQYRPRFADPSRPDASPVLVRTPGGAELEVIDPALAAELGTGVRLIKQDRGVFDTLPLSLISRQSVAALSASIGLAPEVRRFRPNLLVDLLDDEPFAEERWLGRTVTIGGVRMRVDKRDQRCVIVNLDPATSERDPAVLRAIAQQRQACIGVYGATVTPGVVRVGDEVVLEG